MWFRRDIYDGDKEKIDGKLFPVILAVLINFIHIFSPRYSPLLADSKLNPPLKLEVIARYMSISVKRDSAANEGSVKAIAYVSEQSLENPPSSDRSFEVLSKYSKPGEPSILEIFGESPYIMKLGGNSKGDEIDVTGDEGPSTSKVSGLPSTISVRV